MKIKRKFIFSIVCFLLITFMIGTIGAAFSGDSFDQRAGDEYIWEVTFAKGYTLQAFHLQNVGDQLSIVINIVNTTLLNSILYDTLYGTLSNNTRDNRTWTPFSQKILLAAYNSSYGYKTDITPFIIPHNETAVNQTLSNTTYEHYSWTSGPHGYDGMVIQYNGSASGDIGKEKIEMSFHSAGILNSLRIYNGTGGNWDLIFELKLLVVPPLIPSFQLFLIIPILGILVIIYWNLPQRRDLSI